MKEPHHYVE